MIFRWLLDGLKWILRMTVFPPARPPVYPKIDPCALCPSCGHRDGSICAITQQGQPPQVQHTCNVCHAVWYEKPILNVTASKPLIAAEPTKPEPKG